MAKGEQTFFADAIEIEAGDGSKTILIFQKLEGPQLAPGGTGSFFVRRA